MFKQYFRSNFENIAITTKSGKNVTYKSIIRRSHSLTTLFEVLRLGSEDIVGIHTKDTSLGISSLIACLSYGVDFTILNIEDTIEQTRAKMFKARECPTNWLILSEENIDTINKGMLVIDPSTFEVLCKGINFRSKDVEIKEYNKLLFSGIKDILKTEESINKNTLRLPEFFLQHPKALRYSIVFHDGVSKGALAASLLHHKDIVKGLKSCVENDIPVQSPLLNMEPFDNLYNITNGYLIPILQGVHVIEGKSNDFYEFQESAKKSKALSLYINSYKFETFLTELEKEIIPLLKKRFFTFIYSIILRNKFDKVFSNKLKIVIIPGKIVRRKLLNPLGVKFRLLYVLNEVATYFAKAERIYLNKYIRYIPKTDSKVEIHKPQNSKIGEIFIQCIDMADGYLDSQDTYNYFLAHSKAEGKLRTCDAGIIKNDKLIILDKSSAMYNNEYGITLQTEKILNKVNSLPYVKSAIFLLHEEKPTLLIEPNFEYAEMYFIEHLKFITLLQKIKNIVNTGINENSKIQKILVVNNPEGFYRKNYKVISSYL